MRANEDASLAYIIDRILMQRTQLSLSTWPNLIVESILLSLAYIVWLTLKETNRSTYLFIGTEVVPYLASALADWRNSISR